MKTYAVAVRWRDGTTLIGEPTTYQAKAWHALQQVRQQPGLSAALYMFQPIREVDNCIEMGDPDTAIEFSAYRFRADETWECVIDAPTMQLVLTTLQLRIEREGVALI